MPDVHTAVAAQPTPQQLARRSASRPGKVTGKLKTALDAMVWRGMTRAEAAQAAGLQDQSLYVALSKPHVKAYYLAQCEVLRTSGRARRIHRLEAIVEQDENKQAAVNAARALDLLETDPQAIATKAQTPGFIIQIVTPGDVNVKASSITDAAKPLISHDPVSDISGQYGRNGEE